MRTAGLISLGLILLNIAVFVQVRDFDFVNYDDPKYVLENSALRDGLSAEGLRWAFTTTYLANYAPMVWLTFLADFEVYEVDPGGYHLTNMLFHTLNVLLLFAFLMTATGRAWPSAFAAALFAVHPLHVEAVAWVSSRKDVVSTFFWLAAMLSYAVYAKRPRALPYLLTFALFLLGLFSKAMLVTFPCVLLLLDLWPLNRVAPRSPGSEKKWPRIRALLLEKVPFAAAAIAICIVTYLAQSRAGAVSSVAAVPMGDRIANAVAAYWIYLGKTIWPVDLIVHYPYHTNGFSTSLTLLAATSLIAITVGLATLARRRPYLIVGWLWYVGTLVPVIGLVQVGNQAMADRYTYVPLIGVFFAAAWGVSDAARAAPRLGRPLFIAAMLLVPVFAGAAWRQTGYWRDSATLFAHAVEVDADNVVGQSQLGRALYDLGETDAAREHLERAVALQPTHTPALLNLGVLNAKAGRFDDAMESYRRILENKPDHHGALSNMGSVLIKLDRPEEAVEHLEAALRQAPDAPDALINLGAARLMQQRPREAVPPLQRALEIRPDDAVAHLNLAVALYELGAANVAHGHVLEALRLDPEYGEAQEFLRVLDSEDALN